ncbi:hypothetical protein [Primorskyibacter flagellatus]|uniref:Uncharacterized protein n=1 Tax=Primorskyibacter flagellatus TaxID=1387277 RepID=A0A1W2EH31_9RHOB|nr:hypothetical protein [Primorskyibacter flagellatus]SMD08997.1 hypothetical protein SAMN06295998_1291 [Primorskyibacter flagellatus]
MPKPKAQVLHPDTTGAAIHIGDRKRLDQSSANPVQLPDTAAAARGTGTERKKKTIVSQSPQTHLHIAEKYLSEIEEHQARTGVSQDDIIKLVAIALSSIGRFDMPDKEWIATRKAAKGVLVRYAIPQEFVDAYNRKFNPLGVKPQTHPYLSDVSTYGTDMAI